LSFLLNHASEQFVNVVFAIAKITTLSKVVGLFPPSAVWIVKFEGPQKVGSLLEVRANGDDLVDKILNANNASLAKCLLDDGIVSESNALLVDLAEATLVDQLANRLQVGVAPGNVRFGDAEHVDGGLVQLDEHGIVDLTQAEELEHLANLRVNASNTSNTDDKGQLGLSRHVKVLLGAGHSLEANDVLLHLLVLAHVLLGALEDLFTLDLQALLAENERASAVSTSLPFFLYIVVY